MNVCRISMLPKRGSNPDLIIEVEGIHSEGRTRMVKVSIPLLSKDQRYKLGALIYGVIDHVDLPCDLVIEWEGKDG